MSQGYEVLEHTADIGLRAFGDTLEEVFTCMALGMISLILSPDSHVSSREKKHIKVTGYDPESLMVEWLSELLFQIYSENFLLSDIQSIEIRVPEHIPADPNGYLVSATISGEKFRTETHKFDLEIKGVTYHMLKVERLDSPEEEPNHKGKWQAQVILDI
ncbi:MAG: archease [Firmicutes bacterium]|jgi:SHS2 domain-containing protein|nr:archease [Bacillota bacterium]